MKLKFGVTPLLFACVVVLGANSAASAEGITEDRYLVTAASNLSARSSKPRLHRARKHVRVERRRISAKVKKSKRTAPDLKPQIGGSALHALIAQKAAAHGVSAALARAVVRVESNFNPRATGSAGEVGLMQIKYQTARGLGYGGTRAALYEPATNLEWGMRYLAGAHRLAGGDLCGTLAKYNGGHATRGTGTSLAYCGRVRTALNARGA